MTNPIDILMRRVRRAVAAPGVADRTDGQLLASFIGQHDDDAFEALVCRHGPMVWGVCRRTVGHHHDAEDAFQATFLVLARKASAVRPGEGVANWLHGVALRTARKARTTAAKRRGREKQVLDLPATAAAPPEPGPDHTLLAQELNGLPAKYRLPVLLCDLEGETIKEAARQLGWPQGTVAGRLARARKLLARRLANRGAAWPAALLAGPPDALIRAAARAATPLTPGAGAVPDAVAGLAEEVMKSMTRSKLSLVAASLVALGAAAFGSGLLTGQPARREPEGHKPAAVPPAPPPREAGGTARSDLDRFQGAWSVVSIERGGKPEKQEEAAFLVDGRRACWQTGDQETHGRLYLDPAGKPRTFDVAMGARTMEGVYSLDGDTLRLCYNFGDGTEAKRPAGLVPEKGSQQVLLVLKRTHGPEIYPFRLEDGTRAFPQLVEPTAPSAPDTPAPPRAVKPK